jgi:pimeloyl-ACP methyl ester carboxylesterase
MTPASDLVPDGTAEPVKHSGGESLGGDPPPGQCHHVQLGAGRFHYRLWTTEQLSPVSVVLLHGVAGSVASWSRVGPALAAAGTPAFALDLRGHGGSIRPPPGSYGLAAAAGDVADFLTALHLQAPVLVGHCWGADIALALATTKTRHDRPSPNLAGLVLEEPLATLSPQDNAAALRTLQEAIRTPAKHVAALTRRHWHPADRASVLDGLRTADPDITASVVYDGAAAGPLLPLLTRLTTPTLLLRADPRYGGMLTDTHWSLINRLLPTHSTAHHLPDTPHDIHRGNYPTFMRHLQHFLHHHHTA